ncbi:MAG: LuxR C-terminal-related transcriptional regulator [Desulfobacterales bacterium]
MAEGRTTKKIAERLNISVKTVESHRKNIMDKLDLFTVAELTKYAVRRGLTAIE